MTNRYKYLKDTFDVFLYCMHRDCGNKKEFIQFKKAVEKASHVLHKREKK